MSRLFIAIDLPDKLKQKLGRVKDSLHISQARWVKEENLHLTLKFLGEVKKEKIDSISNSLKSLTRDFPVFCFQTGQLGAFPNLKRARVLWIDIKEGREKVQKLAKLIENELSKLGFEKEKRNFEPHITLARLKKPELISQLPTVDWYYSFEVTQVIMFESLLKPTGPIYTPLYVFPLKK